MTATEDRAIHVDPATPTFGAFVEGADLAALDDTTWADIERAFAEHAVLFFRDQHIESPEFQVRFRWEQNSVAMWNNRSTQHYAVWDYFPNTRHGHRVSVVGERPFT